VNVIDAEVMAACEMCATGVDSLVAGRVDAAVERAMPGNWDHPSIDVPGLYATCLASHIWARRKAARP